MRSAAQAYKNVSRQTASPRELEANDALLYNRKLWSVFLSDATDGNNPLPKDVRQNVANLGLFVMNHTVAVLNDPRPAQLSALININREVAAGLLARN
jgi:flagellar protein FlaF